MKNLKYILILITFLLFNIESFGQLPLQFGDGVITHSPNSYSASGPTTTPAVVRVIHTSNTLTAPLGATWTAPSPKPLNDFYNNWNVNNLGYVFGITLDENANPNIYVSSTQIYTNSNINNRKVWRLKGNNIPLGTAGNNSLVYDFNNPSGTGSITSAKSLGNLKYAKINSIENIYVSDWETGEIHRLTGNSTSATLWANQQAFNPKFGKQVDDVTEMPYGLALRKISATSYKLYYAKISTNSNSNSIGGYGNNEIYSVDINPVNGDFMPSTETIANIPNINLPPTTWVFYGGSPTFSCSILPVISDIAFTNDSKKMLIGQQSWSSFGYLAPHNSKVVELQNTPLLSSIWTNTINLFPTGQYVAASYATCPIYGSNNSVGGVSYSDNILQKNSQYECDKSVYFTSDYINAGGGNTVYGIQGMNSTGGSISNSIWIDADDNLNYYDKTFLGDVEIYKNPQTCNPCQCGQWENIGLGNNGNWWNPNSSPTPPVLTFNQGSSTGILFPHYICNGNCAATYTYSVTNANGNNTPLAGTTNLDLSQIAIKNLPCGSYFINVTPKCGNVVCPPIRIPLVIVCPPPCDDCGGNASVTSNGTPTISNGTVSGNFTINNSKPVAEVRVLVEEFRVTSNNENCLICKNPPKTWGSIQSATLGTLSPAFSNALTVDNREVVFNNNAVLSMPSNMLITLALPQSVNLSCCEVQVQVCLKFIIRDVYCCEKEILKCFTFTLQQNGTSTGGTSGTGSTTGGTSGNYPNMNSTGECLPGYKDCDGALVNGCEVNVTNSSMNCGVCGNVCPSGKTCVGGTCQ